MEKHCRSYSVSDVLNYSSFYFQHLTVSHFTMLFYTSSFGHTIGTFLLVFSIYFTSCFANWSYLFFPRNMIHYLINSLCTRFETGLWDYESRVKQENYLLQLGNCDVALSWIHGVISALASVFDNADVFLNSSLYGLCTYKRRDTWLGNATCKKKLVKYNQLFNCTKKVMCFTAFPHCWVKLPFAHPWISRKTYLHEICCPSTFSVSSHSRYQSNKN